MRKRRCDVRVRAAGQNAGGIRASQAHVLREIFDPFCELLSRDSRPARVLVRNFAKDMLRQKSSCILSQAFERFGKELNRVVAEAANDSQRSALGSLNGLRWKMRFRRQTPRDQMSACFAS